MRVRIDFLSRLSDRRGGANNCANNWVIDFVVKRVGRSAISAPYIMRITRHGAPKASHASWTSGKKKGRRDNANNTKEGRTAYGGEAVATCRSPSLHERRFSRTTPNFFSGAKTRKG